MEASKNIVKRLIPFQARECRPDRSDYFYQEYSAHYDKLASSHNSYSLFFCTYWETHRKLGLTVKLPEDCDVATLGSDLDTQLKLRAGVGLKISLD